MASFHMEQRFQEANYEKHQEYDPRNTVLFYNTGFFL